MGLDRNQHIQNGDDIELVNPVGKGRMIFACEHATNFIPEEYAGLGLDAPALESHIAWDLGAWAVARELSIKFDAPLIAPGVSRLLFDCNRSIDAHDAVVEKSEIYDVPGNKKISDTERNNRIERYHVPFHRALSQIIEKCVERDPDVTFVTIHSFSPVFNGESRDLDIGLLHDSDDRLANAIEKTANADGIFDVRSNEPYGIEDGVTYTLAKHALPRGLPNVMLEIRSNLIRDVASQKKMAGYLAKHLTLATEALGRA